MVIGRRRPWRTFAATLGIAWLVVTGRAMAQEAARMTDPTKTSYGEKSPRTPEQLNTFAFLIGKWDGTGRTRMPDGKVAEYPVTWIGRYILDGTAIADEVHAPFPDGSPSLGISFRHYDPNRETWVIEFLNVSGSFLRRQVSQGTGSVTVNGRNVTVASGSPGIAVREHYRVVDDDNWVFRLDVSNDGGKSWDEGPVEFTLRRPK